MGEMQGDELCELFRGEDIERLFDVRQALAARGVDAQVWGDWPGHRGVRPHVMRLMVGRRDLVYARWVAYAAGVDAWSDDETGAGRADRVEETAPPLSRTG